MTGCDTILGNLNPFRYRGYYYDTETGLYFLQTRYYDPEAGRFLNIDSVANADPESLGGLNLYAYCNNNPVMYSDSTGTFVITLGAVFGALLVGFIAGAIAGGVYGGLTAFENNQDIGWGIFIGALSGGLMGAAAGVASLFIAPVLTGGIVVVGTTTLATGAAIGIGTGIALLSGFTFGFVGDIALQAANGSEINLGNAALTGLSWALLNVANAFTVSLGGELTALPNFALSLFFNYFYGSIGFLIDILKGRKANQNNLQIANKILLAN